MTTSKPASCYVYIQLPATLDVVTCGRYVLDRREDGTTLGRFVYGRSYRDNPNAVELDKFGLPLAAETFETAGLRGMFGALRDASPDSWGRRIIEKQLGATDLTELDFLLNSPEDRAGALSFGLNPQPPPPVRRFNRVLQLEALLVAAEHIMNDEETPTISPGAQRQVAQLVQPNTAMGGARPKNVVEDEDGLWLAKFPAREDRWNNAPVEAAMLDLAQLCGIHTAPSRIVRVAGKDILLIKRFDREKAAAGYLRHRMVSALTVLRSDDDPLARTNWSYLQLADELRRWVKEPLADLEELFRRIIFNALISNVDDHPRNHALIAPGVNWLLSPAYDLTPTPMISMEKRDLALEVGDYNRYANRENLLSQCARFRLTRERAGALIDEMKTIVAARWRALVLKAGGTAADCAAIERAFVYPGFEYAPEDVLQRE
jgi:serine/threonine-protein kinase HipA